MDAVSAVEWWAGELGAIAIVGALGFLFAGIFRGLRRFKGEGTSHTASLLLRPLFYILAGAAFFILCWWIWLPLPVEPVFWVRMLGLAIGAPVMFIGIVLIIWSRMRLGKNYFVATSRGALLFEGHRLVMTGPYAVIRHPLYIGILLVGLGGTLLYRTWTMVFVTLMFLGLMIRARREDEALAQHFGEEWQRYRRAVPAWLPKINKRRN